MEIFLLTQIAVVNFPINHKYAQLLTNTSGNSEKKNRCSSIVKTGGL